MPILIWHLYKIVIKLYGVFSYPFKGFYIAGFLDSVYVLMICRTGRFEYLSIPGSAIAQ